MTTKAYIFVDKIISRPAYLAIFSYILALGYLLYTACPLLFAIFIAMPLALAIGVPIMLVSATYILLVDIFVGAKDEYKFH